LKVKAQLDLFCRGECFLEAKGHKQNRQNEAKPPLATRKIGGEIPTEEDEQQKPDKKRQRGRHGRNYSVFSEGAHFKERRNSDI
jgi:hypothetical protein